MLFYKKPSLWPNTKSSLTFGHILVSYKFLNLAKLIAVKVHAEGECSKPGT